MFTASNTQPYCGKEPYIFISYAHRNEREVHRVIRRLQAEGFRVWYDKGIDPGTEWADNIAERVVSCDCFIAFITREYLESTNCLDELNFARDKEKKRLLVYLSNVTLPDGISMRSNRLQAIHKYAYEQEEEFYEKLFRTRGVSECLIPSGQERDASAGQPAAAQPGAVSEIMPETVPQRASGAASASEAVPRTRTGGDKRSFFQTAAAALCLFLAVFAFFLLKDRVGGRADKEAAIAPAAPSAVNLDQGDLGGLAFGMAQDQVREILTAGGARESGISYSDHGLLLVEYADTGSLYGTQVEGLVSTAVFHGREVISLIACFDAEGLYQVFYMLDASQDSGGKALFKELSNRYGKPDRKNTSSYQWNMGSDVTFSYYPPTDTGEDSVLISIPCESYFDMRGFSWGMTPAEAQEAESARSLPLAMTKSGVNSDGFPYQFYEGEWEVHGSPVDLVTLNFVEDQLVELKYALSGESFEKVLDDYTVLYGQGVDMAGDGSAMGWRVRMYDSASGGNILTAITAVKTENGVRLIFRDWERYQTLTGN
ncbi:MAG: toll/interleukin-1 receptor domain-containing protein [Butyrivibrio sp.]|nr:toll/interleukin-1 receptor domain-containing protein [Butyrivibrio sp.]